MQNYLLTLLVNEKVSEEGRTSLFDGIKKNFTTLTKEELWGVKSLSYEIKHNGKAFYAHFEFETSPEAIITLDKNIRLNEDILRYLIVKPRKIKAKKDIVVKDDKKESRPEELKVEAEVKIEAKEVEKKEEGKKTRRGK